MFFIVSKVNKNVSILKIIINKIVLHLQTYGYLPLQCLSLVNIIVASRRFDAQALSFSGILSYSYSFMTRCLGSVITLSLLNHILAELLK